MNLRNNNFKNEIIINNLENKMIILDSENQRNLQNSKINLLEMEEIDKRTKNELNIKIKELNREISILKNRNIDSFLDDFLTNKV